MLNPEHFFQKVLVEYYTLIEMFFFIIIMAWELNYETDCLL